MLNMKEVRRIVVKVGSSTLTYDNGKPNIRRIEQQLSLDRHIVIRSFLQPVFLPLPYPGGTSLLRNTVHRSGSCQNTPDKLFFELIGLFT